MIDSAKQSIPVYATTPFTLSTGTVLPTVSGPDATHTIFAFGDNSITGNASWQWGYWTIYSNAALSVTNGIRVRLELAQAASVAQVCIGFYCLFLTGHGAAVTQTNTTTWSSGAPSGALWKASTSGAPLAQGLLIFDSAGAANLQVAVPSWCSATPFFGAYDFVLAYVVYSPVAAGVYTTLAVDTW